MSVLLRVREFHSFMNRPLLHLHQPALRVGSKSRPRWLHIRKLSGHAIQDETKQAVLLNSQPGDADWPKKDCINSFPHHTKLSLLEELFPEEVDNHTNKANSKCEHVQVPYLSLPDCEHEDPPQDVDSLVQVGEKSRAASKNAYHQWNLTVLVALRVSKSLDQEDFRRTVPKGRHVEDWNGPGDFLKVIPARDQFTLEPSGYYFLLFPNPAYARAYQSHVVALHRISRTHTPTSVESPMSPPPGMVLQGEDVYTVLQNYTLCPPSQTISLKIRFPPYSSGMKRLLDQRGYSQLNRLGDKSCSSVLFWVNGYQLTSDQIQRMIHCDGQHRGLDWNLASGKPIEKTDNAELGADELQEDPFLQNSTLHNPRSPYPRYLIPFIDENEARRFVRAWHRMKLPINEEKMADGEPWPIVHAEFLW